MTGYDIDSIISNWDELFSDPDTNWKEIASVLFSAVTVDDLTGYPTYRVLKADVSHLEREGRSVGILYGDGYIKVPNDTYGKAVGNVVIGLQHYALQAVGSEGDASGFCRVYREGGDESILVRQCSLGVLKTMFMKIRALYREINRLKGSYVLGDQPSLALTYGFDEDELRTLAKDILSGYKLPPELPIYMTLGYSHSPDGQRLLHYLSEARRKQASDKAEFYREFPDLNPRGRINDIIVTLRMVASTRNNR